MISVTEAKGITSYEGRIEYLAEALSDYELNDLCQIISSINAYDGYFEEMEIYDIAEYIIDALNTGAEVDMLLFYEVDKEVLESWKSDDNED